MKVALRRVFGLLLIVLSIYFVWFCGVYIVTGNPPTREEWILFVGLFFGVIIIAICVPYGIYLIFKK